MVVVLMVAEKPLIAKSIAQTLSNGNYQTFKSSATPIHSWNGRFKNRSARFKCLGVTGHVFDVDFPYEYRSWDKTDPLELFDAPIQRKPSGNGKIKRHLEKNSQGIDYLVLWLDCDREGENICYEVISCCQRNMNNGSMSNIYRAHFSSITGFELKKAFNSLGKPDKNASDAVEARKELDLKIGVAFTRFQTRFFKQKYGQLNERELYSYGPCQTPTLGFVVTRSNERTWFKKEKYWTININCRKNGIEMNLKWDRNKIFNKEIAEMFYNNIKNERKIKCINIEETIDIKPRPVGLNTVKLLQVASKGLKIGPKETMRVAEHLYLRGYISYPRTETTAYPKGFNFKQIINAQCQDNDWGHYAKRLLNNGYTQPRKGFNAGDHPPITPVQYISLASLKPTEKKLYKFIVKYFLASISPDCKMATITGTFNINDEIFRASGSKIIDQGFTEIADWYKIGEVEFPEIKNGEYVDISYNGLKLVEKMTEPPEYLTEADLIALMEKHGIGTDASIPQHISNICDREYVVVDNNTRTLKPTQLGLLLGNGYYKIDPELVLPQLRAYMESEMTLIAKGKRGKNRVIMENIHIFRDKFTYFLKKFFKMDEMFDFTYNNPKNLNNGKLFSKCGICKKTMQIYKTRGPPKLFCDKCDEQYTLPKAEIKLTNKFCPICKFEILRFQKPNPQNIDVLISYPFCPYCSNHAPTKEIIYDDKDQPPPLYKHKMKKDQNKKKQKKNNNEEKANDVYGNLDIEEINYDNIKQDFYCNRCWNRNCEYSNYNNWVRPCWKCNKYYERGENMNGLPYPGHYLIFDQFSGPDKWRMCCSNQRCNLMMQLNSKATTFEVRNDYCNTCNAKKIYIDFHKDNIPKELINDQLTSYLGCLWCSPILNVLCTEVNENSYDNRVPKMNIDDDNKAKKSKNNGLLENDPNADEDKAASNIQSKYIKGVESPTNSIKNNNNNGYNDRGRGRGRGRGGRGRGGRGRGRGRGRGGSRGRGRGRGRGGGNRRSRGRGGYRY